MKDIVEKAKEYMLSERKLHKGPPPEKYLYGATEAGQRLAEKLGADKDIVAIGTWLMDIKLPEFPKKKNLEDHLQKCVMATKEFLEKFGVDEESKKKIVNCVEGHHGSVEWTCIEAEICANADCYKFMDLELWIYYLHILSKRGMDFKDVIKQAAAKYEEKKGYLSLDVCKEELSEDMQLIEKVIGKLS